MTPEASARLDTLREICRERRSVRYFDSTPVPRAVIDELLTLGATAPNVENIQPWRFNVILEPGLRASLMEEACYGNFSAGAGTFIVVTCDVSSYPVAATTKQVLWNEHELEYSCVAAMEQIMLGAAAMGLGSCWVSLHHGTTHEKMGLAHAERVVGGVLIGHYRPGEERASNGHERRPMSEIIRYRE